MNDEILKALIDIAGSERVSTDETILSGYSSTEILIPVKKPACVVWPLSTEEIRLIVELANKYEVGLSPVSSGSPKLRGDSAPKEDGMIAVDLSKMKKIIRVDKKNKVTIVESGVTYGELLPELERAGLRPLMPLLPKASKSVVASLLDREPITSPRFHWDSSDPLLCTETVFGSGDLFRTGAAAGPGTIEEQWASGQAQKNPMGPSQFDPFRIIQGSQGTIGIVAWTSIKCEMKPEFSEITLAGSNQLESLYDFTYAMLKRRLVDDFFILNSLSLASTLQTSTEDIDSLRKTLPEWVLIMSQAGYGLLGREEIEYRMADTKDIADETDVSLSSKLGEVDAEDVRGILWKPSPEPYWKLRYRGACREIFFLSTLDKTNQHISTFKKSAQANGFPADDIGVYLQPTIQGTNTHCSFDIFYDSNDSANNEAAQSLFIKSCEDLMDQGAYFSRPLPSLADSIFTRSSPEILTVLRSVKDIFDPNHVLSPGNLCFKEVQQ